MPGTCLTLLFYDSSLRFGKLRFFLPWRAAILWNSCSALKEAYRQALVKRVVGDIYWFCLKGTFELIKQRLDSREDHFFKSDLLDSQFKIIEYPDYCKFIDISESPDIIVEKIKSEL